MTLDQPSIYTVGHSTRPFDEFVSMLRSHEIQAIADVRRYPRSRRWPHFNDKYLTVQLPAQEIVYTMFQSLGGRRKADINSTNDAWISNSFRGYADYMQTPAFKHALDELIVFAKKHRTAIMCAEQLPWRCHRQLIADSLLIRGWQVFDIFSDQKCTPHLLTSFAHVEAKTVTYPASEQTLFSAQ